MWGLLPVLVCIATLVCSCEGVTFQFVQLSGNNHWEIPGNWNPVGIPTSNDDVIIPYTPGGEYTVTINSEATCRSLTIGGPTASGIVETGTWDPANTQTLSLVSGILSISGNCTVYQSGILGIAGEGITGLSNGTTIMVKGGLLFGNGGTHTVSTLGIVVESGGYLSIAGETNGVILSDRASITIQHLGNFTLASQYGINTNDNTPVSVVNYGDFYCAPASIDNFVTQISVPFHNNGNFYVQSGQMLLGVNTTWHGTLSVVSTLNITGGVHQFFSDSTIVGGGTLQVQSDATVTLQGAISISYFVLALGGAKVVVDNKLTTTQFSNFLMLDGTLSGTPTAINEFTWAGGLVSISNLAVAELQIIGAFTASLTATPLTVIKQATFQNTTHLLLFNSTFTLEQGAQMTFNYEIFFICGKNDTISALQIGGELTITYPDPITLTCNLVVLPTGVIATTSGLLDIQTTVSSSGMLNISPGAAVILETTSTFFVGSSITGGGTLNCQSCTAQISGNVNLGTLNFAAGTIIFLVESATTDYVATVAFFNQSGSSSLMLMNYSPANLNFTVVDMNFAGGNISSNYNAQLNLQANFIITNSSSFMGTLPYLFTNVALINYGTTNFYGNGDLKLWQSSLIYNAPTGTMQITRGSLQVSQNDQSGYLSEIRNEGQFLVNLGATAQLALNFHNLGYLAVSGQVFIVSGFFTQVGDSICNIVGDGSVTLTNPGLFLGGILKGSGLIKGTVTLDGTATLIVDNTSSPIINTFLLRGSGTVLVDIASTGILQVQSLCQIYGGNLALYSSLPVAYSRQYASSPAVVGSGFDNIVNASLNATFGFSITNTTSGLFAVVAPKPTITTMTPAVGVSGTVVTLTGTNFIVGSAALNIYVLFQGVAVPTTVVTILSVTAVVPVGTGTVSVVIMTDGRVSNQQQWTYSPPAIQSVAPQSGPAIGTNLVTITGSNFGVDTTVVGVTFGWLGPCAITELTNTQIVCAAPPGVGANVSVTVQANQQTSVPSHYTYYPPVLQSVYPSVIVVGQGSNTGPITVTGQNLAYSPASSNITIQIGKYLCTNVTQASLTTFICEPPLALVEAGSNHYAIAVIVAGQSSTNLTFRVFTDKPQNTSTNHWWSLPWWIFVAAGGTLIVFLAIGIVTGCKVANKGATRGGYEPITSETQQEKRRSIVIN